jgi:hypothetical protein
MTNEYQYHIVPHSPYFWKQGKTQQECLEYTYTRLLKEHCIEKADLLKGLQTITNKRQGFTSDVSSKNIINDLIHWHILSEIIEQHDGTLQKSILMLNEMNPLLTNPESWVYIEKIAKILKPLQEENTRRIIEEHQ